MLVKAKGFTPLRMQNCLALNRTVRVRALNEVPSRHEASAASSSSRTIVKDQTAAVKLNRSTNATREQIQIKEAFKRYLSQKYSVQLASEVKCKYVPRWSADAYKAYTRVYCCISINSSVTRHRGVWFGRNSVGVTRHRGAGRLGQMVQNSHPEIGFFPTRKSKNFGHVGRILDEFSSCPQLH
jgi:hypothetical protein